MASKKINSPKENIDCARFFIGKIRKFFIPCPPQKSGELYLSRLAFYGLLCRVAELGELSADSLESSKLASGALLSRAVGETTAIAFNLSNKAQAATSTDAKIELEEVAKGALSGSRLWADEMTAATNVLTHVDKLDKEIHKYRFIYDVLSEYAHPNSLGLFATVDREGNALSEEENNVARKAKSLCLSSAALFLRVSVARAFSLALFSNLRILYFKKLDQSGSES